MSCKEQPGWFLKGKGTCLQIFWSGVERMRRATSSDSAPDTQWIIFTSVAETTAAPSSPPTSSTTFSSGSGWSSWLSPSWRSSHSPPTTQSGGARTTPLRISILFSSLNSQQQVQHQEFSNTAYNTNQYYLNYLNAKLSFKVNFSLQNMLMMES